MDAENYCFDLNNSFGCLERSWASSECNILYVICTKNVLKAGFVLVFEKGNAAKCLVGNYQSHS